MLDAASGLGPVDHLKAVEQIVGGYYVCQFSARFEECGQHANSRKSARQKRVFTDIYQNVKISFLCSTLRWWRWWLSWCAPSPFAGSPTTCISWFISSTRTCLNIPSLSRSIWLSCGWQWAPLCTTPLSTAASMTGNFTRSQNTVIDAHAWTSLSLPSCCNICYNIIIVQNDPKRGPAP